MEHIPYAVLKCRGDYSVGYYGCGSVEITREDYFAQLFKPDSTWTCPHCGCQAEYDDIKSEELQQNL